MNGATGVSNMAGEAARVAGRAERERARYNGAAGTPSDIDGQTQRSNRAFGKTDIEGKAAMGSSEQSGN